MAEKSPEQVETERRTRAAVDAYVAAWTEGDRDALLAAFAPDATWVDPVGTPPYEGREAIGGFWDQAHAGGVNLKPEVHRIVVCGDEAILLFTMMVRNADGSGMVNNIAVRVIPHVIAAIAGTVSINIL